MNVETVNVVVSFATLVVVAAASVAAIVQLRHLRTSNQLSGQLEILNQWNIPTVQAALSELKRIPAKMQDPAYVKMLDEPGSVDRASYPEFLAMDLWEQIGTYVKRGLIDEGILLDITSAQVVNAWNLVEPVVAVLRVKRGPSTFENFEYLAVRATLFTQRYPDGTYPAGVPRMSDL